jgi:hypothetical protein
VLLWHVGKQVGNNVPSIAGRLEVLIGFDNVDHSGMSLSRERTAASNKGMKQTSVEHIGRSQLIPGVGRTIVASRERSARSGTTMALAVRCVF